MTAPSELRRTAAPSDLQRVELAFRRLAEDLSLLFDCSVGLVEVEAQLSARKARGEGTIHISFKLGFQSRGLRRHGSLLVPLGEAITLASHFFALPAGELALRRSVTELDRSTKDGMLEVGHFIASAVAVGLRTASARAPAVVSEGCQGVPLGRAPSFPHERGAELLIGRARMEIVPFGPFDAWLMMPADLVCG